jgi:hypothetical protein
LHNAPTPTSRSRHLPIITHSTSRRARGHRTGGSRR